MTREQAIAEAKRRTAAETDATWIATQRDGRWTVARVDVAPGITPKGTATTPPPVAPRDDSPHNAPGERANWLAG